MAERCAGYCAERKKQWLRKIEEMQDEKLVDSVCAGNVR